MIHGIHSTVTVYYAKLPNQYLSEISHYGSDYLDRSEKKTRIKLQRTKRFHLRDKTACVELFTVLANLLWYLVSGNSHVGYLANYLENPLHKAVPTPSPLLHLEGVN